MTQIPAKQTSPSADGNWLTAKALIDATGISKADLIRFIQLNVLPKSSMRVLPVGQDTTRKKSYFAPSLLAHVAMLKRLRNEGHAVETIAKQYAQKVESAPNTPMPASLQVRSAKRQNGNNQAHDLPPYFHFPASAIRGSAFFVNQDMYIVWVKVAHNDCLFQAIRDEKDDDPSGTVFEILLRASLKALVFNWQPLFSFIYRFLADTIPPEIFKQAAPLVSFHQEGLDHPSTDLGRSPAKGPRIDSCPIRLENEKGSMQAMRLYAMALSECALFIFEEDRWQDEERGGQSRGMNGNSRSSGDPAHTKIPFSVISARLDNSQRLVDTMLPETYHQLITRIWNESDRIVQSYGGQPAKRSGTEAQYIIPWQSGPDPAYDAIRCAIELREKVKEIEASLKAGGGWFPTICLNMGISSGKDHLPENDPTASAAFMLPGAAADQACSLSAIAQGGRILITKSAFGHLSQQQMKSIAFGIYRDKLLIPKIFAQLSELSQDAEAASLSKEIRSMFVTHIADLKFD